MTSEIEESGIQKTGDPVMKDGKESRRDWKVIKGLVVGQIVTLILALTGLSIAVLNLSAKADSIQTSRIDSKRDNCNLLKGLVLSSATNPESIEQINAYIATTPLADCERYAHGGITTKRPKPIPPLAPVGPTGDTGR